jgi:glycosyltransferase involved in cell wall biosynthesis
VPRADTLLVIPAFNEAASLPAVLDGAARHADRLDVLVVDDGSADATAQVARARGARVLSLPFNLGIGGALETGFKYAWRQGYAFVVRIDGDGQHEAADLPRVLAPVVGGEVDFASGSRFGAEGPAPTGLSRRVGIALLSALVSRLVGRPVRDPTSGFLAFNRAVLAAFMDGMPTDFPEVEGRLELHRRGFRLAEVPVRFHPRRGGRSSITFWRSIYYMIKVTFAVLILAVRAFPPGDPRRPT